MKSNFKKILGFMCAMILLFSFGGCNSNNSTNIEKENTNVKDESSNSENNESNIILVENEKIASVLSENDENPDLEEALREKYDLDKNSSKQTRYYYNYVDLDGDGVNEIFAEVVGRYTNGNGVDNAIIYKEHNGILKEVDDFMLINNPVIISEEKTNGWNDIIIDISENTLEKKYVVLKYDGEDYSDVDESETIESIMNVNGIAIISNDMANDLEAGRGLYLG